MDMKLVLELDDEMSALLSKRVQEINDLFDSKWTMETLAASFIHHVLIDDLLTEQTMH